MAILIDTTVWVELERRGLGLGDLGRLGSVEPPAIATITAAELLVGVHRAHPPARQAKRLTFVEHILSTVEVVPLDLVAAREYARAWADLAAVGTPIGPLDLIVAATALARGDAVLNDNVREFARVRGLTVRQPTWPP
jgi:tRNA(fMet)-specific endonuclease VapC